MFRPVRHLLSNHGLKQCLASVNRKANVPLRVALAPSSRVDKSTPLGGVRLTAPIAAVHTDCKNCNNNVCGVGGCGKISGNLVSKREQSSVAAYAEQEPESVTIATNVNANVEDATLDVTWRDDSVDKYPFVWLRDNCQCERCFHPNTKSRLVLMQYQDIDAKPTHVELDASGDRVLVTWPDGHVSPYPGEWLHQRSFRPDAQEKRKSMINVKQESWGHTFKNNIPTADFQRVLAEKEELYRFLYSLEKYGLFMMKNVPTERDMVQRLCSKMGLVKTSHYGGTFEVTVLKEPSNLDKTNAKLGLHVDLPYYEYAPGIQMLHCIKQFEGEGGDSEFVDGFRVAEQMKEVDPESYEIMKKVPIDFYDIGTDHLDFHKIVKKPLFTMDEHGERLVRINYNDQVRDSYLTIPLHQVRPLYKAMKLFNTLMYHPQNFLKVKMNSGEIVVFDNLRVMHGRSAFGLSQSGNRHLQGAFVDWDEAKSTLRVLRDELGTYAP